jgi:two-component sensor histidine kinase
MKAFRERLSALAAAHNLLTQGGWERTTLADVAQQTITATCAEAERVSFSGPLVQLGPKTAVTLAMALHELCTNAVKYGALSNAGGRVEMTWSLPAEDEGALRIVWRERGGPPIESSPSRKGFGTRMIELALAQELGGDVRMDYETDGLVCTINGSLKGLEPA